MNRGVYLVVQCIILVWSVEQDGPSSTLICHHNLLVVPRGCLICTASLSSNQLLHHLTVLLSSSRLMMDEDEMEKEGRGGEEGTSKQQSMHAWLYMYTHIKLFYIHMYIQMPQLYSPFPCFLPLPLMCSFRIQDQWFYIGAKDKNIWPIDVFNTKHQHCGFPYWPESYIWHSNLHVTPTSYTLYITHTCILHVHVSSHAHQIWDAYLFHAPQLVPSLPLCSPYQIKHTWLILSAWS